GTAAGAGAGAGGHAQLSRRTNFKDKWHARLYSHQEVEALVDGVLKYGCDWTAILRDNTVLRNRNQNSIKYKWASLCHGSSNGWESMRAERPSPALCSKIQQAINGLSSKATQPQVATARRYWGDKSAPLVVPNDLVYELYGPHAVREKAKITVRLNGVLDPTIHHGSLRLIAAHNKYQVVHCPSLRLAATGRQVVGWERGTEAVDLVAVLRSGSESGDEEEGAGGGGGGGADGSRDVMEADFADGEGEGAGTHDFADEGWEEEDGDRSAREDGASSEGEGEDGDAESGSGDDSEESNDAEGESEGESEGQSEAEGENEGENE
ncbi:hypothetical protein Vafri_13265, partial [Volvox africanus]